MMQLAKHKYMMSCTGDKPAMHACLHVWNHWPAQRCHDVAGFCARFLFFPLTFPPFFQILLIEGQYHLDCEGSTGDL